MLLLYVLLDFPLPIFLGVQHLYIIPKMSPSEPERAVGARNSARSLRVKQKAAISRIKLDFVIYVRELVLLFTEEYRRDVSNE